MAKARAEAYSDEEYEDLSEFQRRRRRPQEKGDRMGQEENYDMGRENQQG